MGLITNQLWIVIYLVFVTERSNKQSKGILSVFTHVTKSSGNRRIRHVGVPLALIMAERRRKY